MTLQAHQFYQLHRDLLYSLMKHFFGSPFSNSPIRSSTSWTMSFNLVSSMFSIVSLCGESFWKCCSIVCLYPVCMYDVSCLRLFSTSAWSTPVYRAASGGQRFDSDLAIFRHVSDEISESVFLNCLQLCQSRQPSDYILQITVSWGVDFRHPANSFHNHTRTRKD